MARDANDVLVGGGRVFARGLEIGWLDGTIQIAENNSSQAIIESEGATVKVIFSDKETHFTFSLLEANIDTLVLLNPSYVQIMYGETDVAVPGEIIKDISLVTQLKHYPIVESVTPVVYAASYTAASLVAGATEVYFNSVRNFAAGDEIQFIKDALTETKEIAAIDTINKKVTLTTAVLNPFPAGTGVINNDTTMTALTDYNLFPRMGVITRAEGSAALLAGDSVAVAYTYHQYSGRGYGYGSFSSAETYPLEFWHKKGDGNYRCLRMFKAQLSGNFTPFSVQRGNSSPIAVDCTLLADESIIGSDATRRNIYEQVDYPKDAAPGGGW
jgi:hypothetical protein